MPPRFAAGIAGNAILGAAFVLLSLLAAAADAVAQQPAKPKIPATNSPPPVKPSTAENTKCIGVVSPIGDTFSLKKIGITVFGNELNTVSN
jgi:hypothetical protein